MWYSSFISGSQRLPNGNTLICSGADGRFFEITPDNKKVWEYINPESHLGPITQGQPIPLSGSLAGNIVFRCTRYAPAVTRVSRHCPLLPEGPIELNPLPSTTDCEIISHWQDPTQLDWKIYPNPAQDQLWIEWPEPGRWQVSITNLQGQRLWTSPRQNSPVRCDLRDFPPGLYFVKVAHTVRKLLVIAGT